jgi:uncharacterized membrane protein YhfC
MMLVLYGTRILNGLLMILLPIICGFFIWRRYQTNWRLWWIGAVTMALAQVGHIPFNNGLTHLFKTGIIPNPPEAYTLVFNALVLGLSAGLWEELFRYSAYRWWAKDARSYDKALMMGAGHGGIEAIVLGIYVLYVFLQMLVLRNMDLAQSFPPERVVLLQQQLQTYWSVPWYVNLGGALERIFALIFHLTASVLVLQVFLRKQIRWLWLAIFWHAALDALAVALAVRGILAVEGVLAVFTLVNLAVLYMLRNSGMAAEQAVERAVPSIPLDGGIIPAELESQENLENSKYYGS